MPDVLIALCTCPDTESARQLARILVDEHLAACVSRLPGVTSTYRWQGQVEEATEVMLLIKTTHTRLAALTERITQWHPYEIPELIALDIADGLPAYLAWLQQAVTA